MDKLHFDDLTAITAPFGLLDDDTQQRLRAWPHGLELFTMNGWEGKLVPFWGCAATYRARPAPLVPDYVDWSHVAAPFNWYARDANGDGFFYENKPSIGGNGWSCGDGTYCRSAAHASCRRGTVDWRDSLISRPEVEG